MLQWTGLVPGPRKSADSECRLTAEPSLSVLAWALERLALLAATEGTHVTCRLSYKIVLTIG